MRKPLRDPGSSGLAPAMVVHRVENGKRVGKINKPEAQEIVALLKSCMQQPEYEEKTFGIISLLGGDQARLIQQMLFQEIETFSIEKHRILCGDASNFQGDERDVVFLSLVDSGQDDGPLRMTSYGADDVMRKRYNVATSRAKDQLWVVHSLDIANDLKSGDIRKELLDYASNPRAFDMMVKQSSQGAESPFEAEVGRFLATRGYRFERQKQVGAYRLDIVVSGEDSQVALECDGERWHSGEEKIRQDMERQAILERIGWRFIRIRGSEFYRNRDKAMERVFQELGQMGIAPCYSAPKENDVPFSDLLQRVRSGARDELSRFGQKEVSGAPSSYGGSSSSATQSSATQKKRPQGGASGVRQASDLPNCEERLSSEGMRSLTREKSAADASKMESNFTETKNAQPVVNTSHVRRAGARRPYVSCELSQASLADPQEYIQGTYRDVVLGRMRQVIETEAPVEMQRMFNLVRGSLGVKRSGNNIQAYNENLLRKKVACQKTEFGGSTFLWREDQNPDEYGCYRPNNNAVKREATEIPYEEIMSSMADVLHRSTRMSRCDLIDKAARKFGYKRTASNIKKVFGEAIDEGIRRGELLERKSLIQLSR